MNTTALMALVESAAAWAKAYARLTEELMKAGVPEQKAREEARFAANMAALTPPNRKPPEPWEL